MIGATNFPDALDPALVRPGRFDKRVDVPLPDVRGRQEIIELYLTKMKAGPNVDTNALARGTPGCSGADLFHIINTAAVHASKNNKEFLTNEDLEYAKDKVLMVGGCCCALQFIRVFLSCESNENALVL